MYATNSQKNIKSDGSGLIILDVSIPEYPKLLCMERSGIYSTIKGLCKRLNIDRSTLEIPQVNLSQFIENLFKQLFTQENILNNIEAQEKLKKKIIIDTTVESVAGTPNFYDKSDYDCVRREAGEEWGIFIKSDDKYIDEELRVCNNQVYQKIKPILDSLKDKIPNKDNIGSSGYPISVYHYIVKTQDDKNIFNMIDNSIKQKVKQQGEAKSETLGQINIPLLPLVGHKLFIELNKNGYHTLSGIDQFNLVKEMTSKYKIKTEDGKDVCLRNFNIFSLTSIINDIYGFKLTEVNEDNIDYIKSKIKQTLF